MSRLWVTLGAWLLMGVFTSLAAQAQTAPPSADQSDPKVMGWMQGFPPPDDKLITQPDSNYFSFPKLRWSVCHLREFLPTEQISRGLGAPMPLSYPSPAELADLRSDIDALTFVPMNSADPMTWEQSLSENYTDGMLILHRGEVVYERYFGCLEEGGKHAIMSMTKSITGLLAEILVAEGVLDDTLLVRDVIPEIGTSAFATARVREVVNMTTGVQYSEDYSDPSADIWLYSAAASPLPKPEGYEGPDGYWEYLQQVSADGAHGGCAAVARPCAGHAARRGPLTGAPRRAAPADRPHRGAHDRADDPPPPGGGADPHRAQRGRVADPPRRARGTRDRAGGCRGRLARTRGVRDGRVQAAVIAIAPRSR